MFDTLPESLLAFFSLFLQSENQLILMFISALLSATLLPGNSELLFSTFASQILLGNSPLVAALCGGSALYSPLLALWLAATLGNSLGSLSTYAVARFIPPPNFAENLNELKNQAQSHSQKNRLKWALAYSQRYGVWVLLFSWLPVVGDLFCGVAGWLRFPFWRSLLLITLGKGARYGLILASLSAFWG